MQFLWKSHQFISLHMQIVFKLWGSERETIITHQPSVLSFAGVVAAIVFTTLCVLAVLIRFLYQHREPRPPPANAVKNQRPSLHVEPSKPNHVSKEYFIWQGFSFCTHIGCIIRRNKVLNSCTRASERPTQAFDTSVPLFNPGLLLSSDPSWTGSQGLHAGRHSPVAGYAYRSCEREETINKK